ncbi:uncharacterized protein TNCV_1236621 [Trichonephila clavipes]|nr:uncharacterized protein TNCV_1236621 [Trichonephila clavipes]
MDAETTKVLRGRAKAALTRTKNFIDKDDQTFDKNDIRNKTSFSLYSIHEDFYQKLWLTKTDWDSPIPKQLTKDWLRFQKAFNEINYLTVSRWVILTAENTVELHGFADASSLAYAAAIYCRQKHNGKIKVQLLVSKTKVAPVKQVSIPRLELCGAHLLSKLFK